VKKHLGNADIVVAAGVRRSRHRSTKREAASEAPESEADPFAAIRLMVSPAGESDEDALTIYCTYIQEGHVGKVWAPPVQVYGMANAVQVAIDRLTDKQPGSKAEVREGHYHPVGRGIVRARYKVGPDGAITGGVRE
jgi:hypothetical protein